MSHIKVIIVSGLSGSGKSIALHALEDEGYYCVDNLPVRLLPSLVTQLRDDGANGHIAVGIDVRNRSFLEALPSSLEALTAQDIDHDIIFLDANDDILVKRYKETRRKHPLMDDDTSLLEGISLERERLKSLSLGADLRIDTTYTTPHILRQQLRDFISHDRKSNMTLVFRSFGYKHGTPLDADYVFDIRCLPNPYWQPALRRYTGLDEPVIAFLDKQTDVQKMINSICEFLEKWLPAFNAEQRAYITVGIGCTGGQHRSVFIAERLARHFAAHDFRTLVRHRELA